MTAEPSGAAEPFDAAVRTVLRAASARELFGPPGPAHRERARARYRELARAVHPDQAPPGRRAEATEAFTRLAARWAEHCLAAAVGTDEEFTLRTARGEYRVEARPEASGEMADLFPARRAGDDERLLLKLPRGADCNDLMATEAEALTLLHTGGDPRFRPYAPRLVETFRHRDGDDGTERRANVLQRLDGFRSLAEVRDAFPGGVDPRDAAWMWRRLLVGIGWAHRAGVIHGAVLPEHVLIHPDDHGLALVDWCYAVVRTGRITAIVSRYADWYPPEVAERRPAVPATDIALATRCMVELIGERIPPEMRAFARGCSLPAAERRPKDAWRLLAEFDDLLDRLYGPRVFRPFALP
ncbi:molecular chaperone DnaJ [Allonocardiopsis opalescens]|uniref:Protein kinase domain-containing protein n=1 Tax=Allonocardiopsis opalescens TaxID=1144618 RepID=A0A2T0PXF6_9ACTN|nr:molecular chaperone DnaJ [Allonocardiopsis opalescens]PRX96076.1 hypothetical protein CLV72_10880 [Allonocardiopsis opalescens]